MTEPWTRDGRAGPVWSFDGNMQFPTFSPSLLIYKQPTQPRCHSFVRKGQIQYCSDCDHELAGKTVELPEVDSLP